LNPSKKKIGEKQNFSEAEPMNGYFSTSWCDRRFISMLKHFQAINVSAVFKAIVGEFDISLK